MACLLVQEASKRSTSWLPPPWAMVAMLFLGFNEFMMLLRCFFRLLSTFLDHSKADVLETNIMFIFQESVVLSNIVCIILTREGSMGSA